MEVSFTCLLFLLFVSSCKSYYQLVNSTTTHVNASSVYLSFFPNNTIDGKIQQSIANCLHTGVNSAYKSAWLSIDLGKIFSIKSVKFWYRNDRKYANWNTRRLPGYSILVSNDSNVPGSESSCYTDPGNVTLPTVIEKGCVRTSRYVWFYQTNIHDGPCPMLEICEVQIFGCATQSDNDGCLHACHHCKETCGIERGECDRAGCASPGYQWPLCVDCRAGLYGQSCSYDCSMNCIDASCDKETGTCKHGCKTGYTGGSCNTACPNDSYGINCTGRCSGHCLYGATCNKVDGTCTACMPGWQNRLCDKPCPDGTYGTNCMGRCSGHCLHNTTCNKTDGKCAACMAGWTGEFCRKVCPDDSYGINCTSRCSGHCLNGVTCNKSDGTCTACMPGWQNRLCDEPCVAGWYGFACKNQCGHCFGADICLHINGSCPGNCSDGYTGENCTDACGAGWYGSACKKQCGNCFGTDICYHTNGSCPGNCSDGFTGDECFDSCENGWYGPGCNESCGQCAGSDVCIQTNGSCPGNCSDGYIGEKCSESCPDGKYGPACEIKCGFCNGSDVCLNTNGSCPGICSDGYIGEKCITKIAPLHDPEGIPVKAITITLLAIVFSSVIIFGLLIFLKRRGVVCRRKQIEQFSPRRILLHAEEHNDIEPDIKEDHVYYNTFQMETKKIPTLDLMTTIQTLEADNNKDFEKEFNSIPYGERPDISCTVGKTSENTPKNRFKEIFPYDHSRVVLKATQDRDYINASFIKNAYGQIAYIATQAPKHSTVVDFWQMVWQENIGVIAMVTDLTEGGSIKCVMYWPESSSKNLVKGKFIVHLVNEKYYANFAVRRLKIDNKETKTSRHVTQLQFTGWPDHGSPHPVDLLVFYHYVSREMEKCPESKLVVHCSAGVGRTGTFIALDALYRQGQKEGKINIVEYVNTMREDRMNMIQKFNQYKFLYKILNESFRSGCHFVNKCDFVSRTQSEMSPENKAANFSYFRKEFKELDSVKPVYTENDLKVGKQNLDLNMTKTVLPFDRMRVVLSSYVLGRGTYYNAVPLSSFKKKDCIVAAQYPVPGAAVDLIRLMVDHTCATLVSTMPLDDIPSTNEWYNLSTKHETLLNYQVEVDEGEKLSDHVTRSSVRMKSNLSKDWHTVDIYEMKPWDLKEDTSGSVETILDVVNIVLQNENVDPENKLLILSRDGATGCGVFCAVYNAIQQLQQDEEVDMFTIVRQLQSRRPEMIPDINEYMCCCQAVARFIGPESENIYMNSEETEETHETEVDPGNTEENMYANM